MIVREVDIRRWNVVFHFSFDRSDMERLLGALVWADAPDSIIQKVSENIGAGRLNEGFCFSNPRQRKTVVGVGHTSSGPEFLDTTIHEIVHVAQDIAHSDGIEPWGEDFAYLAGDISRCVSDVVCEMSCPHCRRQ